MATFCRRVTSITCTRSTRPIAIKISAAPSSSRGREIIVRMCAVRWRQHSIFYIISCKSELYLPLTTLWKRGVRAAAVVTTRDHDHRRITAHNSWSDHFRHRHRLLAPQIQLRAWTLPFRVCIRLLARRQHMRILISPQHLNSIIRVLIHRYEGRFNHLVPCQICHHRLKLGNRI